MLLLNNNVTIQMARIVSVRLFKNPFGIYFMLAKWFSMLYNQPRCTPFSLLVLQIGLFVLIIMAIICTQLWSTVSWLIQFRRLFTVCFFVSIIWNWFYLYKVKSPLSSLTLVWSSSVLSLQHNIISILYHNIIPFSVRLPLLSTKTIWRRWTV